MTKYAEILFRHRVKFTALLLIPIVLGAIVAVAFASYRVSATLRIEDPAAFGATFEPVGWSASQTPAQNLADSLAQLIKTRAFSQSLSARLSSSGSVSSAAELQQTLASAATELKVGVVGQHLVSLAYTCRHKEACLLVVSSTIEIFGANLAQAQQEQVASTNAFWIGQLADAKANLATAQVAQLDDSVRLWRAKVVEAQDGLAQAQYLAGASARFLQIGTTVADPPHLTSAQIIGDGTSLVPAALIVVLGVAIVCTAIVLLAWADKTARDPKALERRLGLPVVATIPKLVSSSGV